MRSAKAGDLAILKHATGDRKEKRKKKVSDDISTISQHAGRANQKSSKNCYTRNGTLRRRRKSRIPTSNNSIYTSLIAYENGFSPPKTVFRYTAVQSAVNASSRIKCKINDVSSAVDVKVCDSWERRDIGCDCEKRRKKRYREKNSFCLVTFAASTSGSSREKAFVSSNESDVISLSGGEESENLEVDTEFTLFEQGDDLTKQLQTLQVKEVSKCLTPDKLKWQMFLDNAFSERTNNANSLKNKGRTPSSRYGEEVGVNRTRRENEVLVRSNPIMVWKDSFDGLDLIRGTHKFIQNGDIELKIEKLDGKDFIHLILSECCGSLEDPEQVVQGGFKACTSAVLHENTSVEVMYEALIDLAEQLEQISRDSFCPGEKLPHSVSKYSLPYLEKQRIYPLKKKSSRFPRAIYYCGLCCYHICSVAQSVTHFLSQEHIGNKEKAELLKKLGSLPGPSKEQMIKVDQIIQDLYDFIRLKDERYEVGLRIANSLSDFLQGSVHRSYSVMVYGSYRTKLATARSNLNLVLNFPFEYSLGHALSRVMEALDDSTLGKDFVVGSVSSDFQRPDPSIHCIVDSVAVVITAKCIRQQHATQLINLYCVICSQFRILATVFHSWAELCSLTDVQLGGMPKFAFDMMLIYYLQHKGFLPFVFEILTEEEIMLLDNENFKFGHQVDKINTDFCASNVEWNFGKIWVDLFRYYAIEHPVEELVQIRVRQRFLSEHGTRWNKKRLAVEDPFAPDHIMQPQQRMYGYFASCFFSTYLHFALPRTAVGSLIPYSIRTPKTVDVHMKKKQKRKSRKTTLSSNSCSDEAATNNDQENNSDIKGPESTGMQVTEVDVNKQEIVTAIGLESMTEVADLHSTDNLSCNDTSFLQKTNLFDENSLVSGKCTDLQMSFSSPAASCLVLNKSSSDVQRGDIDETCCDGNLKNLEKHHTQLSELSSLRELELSTVAVENLCIDEEYDKKDGVAKVKLASASILKFEFHDYDEVAIHKLWLALKKSEYDYPWALHCFTSGLELVVRCTCCNADGHLRESCPELMIPKPKNFPPLTDAQKKIIDIVISDVFNAMRIKPYYVHHMSSLCRELESWLRRFYRTDCRLSLFGSAGNGFGLLGSDVDICLRFAPEMKPKDINSVDVICKVAEVIRKMPNVVFVCEIPHAKVPIVKFRCRNHCHLEADVSLYNVLALENTRLLRTYSKLDRRIHQLGIMTKMWAKKCEIGNASKGSLSSYSFIIMLIHYLQRTNPSVAPFLQEIAPAGRPREPTIIDDCDVYFCNLEDLKWTIHNRSTVGELWMGFLDYFGTKFDFTREVIQIRQTSPLLKLDKGWQSRPIAIEDPFDLAHNLSSGVHSKTMAYIQKSFIQSWEKFNSLFIPNLKLNHNSLVLCASLLLSSCRVGNGPPLVRNCCHRCRQVGHFVMDCPMGMQDKIRNK